MVDDLINVCGYYPLTSDKENLAKAIVSTFPQLGQYTCEDIPAHTLWFNAKGSRDGKKAAGRIEFRLEHVRLKLSPNKKKNIINKKTELPISEEISLVQTEQIKNLLPTEDNFQKIKEFMCSTFEIRRAEINKNLDISKKYQHLFFYKGLLINMEFERMDLHRGGIHKLKEFSFKIRKEIDFISDPELKTLVTITLDLNTKNLKRTYCQMASSSCLWEQMSLRQHLKPLIQWIEPEDDVDSFIRRKDENQPFLLCKSREVFSTDGEFFIVWDQHFMDCQHNIISAFDILFKMHYVLNIKFPTQLKKFYNFFECYIYKIKNIPPVGTVSIYHNNITNIEP